MNDFLTIGWITCRKNPGFRWFADSLKRELHGQPKQRLRVVIVDFHCEERRANMVEALHGIEAVEDYVVVPPKPTVWQGPHRLTQCDYFAAANATNTALCHAKDGWFACVDDLSVLMPGWLASVFESRDRYYIACGAFRKVNKLVVKNGVVESFEDHRAGWDSRWDGVGSSPVDCSPTWFFGCSFACPVEALLRVNGFPEAADGMGYQDSITGQVLERNGYKFKYDCRMLTYESEEHHHNQPNMKRDDPLNKPEVFENARNDKSHGLLRMCRNAKRFDQDFGDGITDLRVLRERILSGGQFPIRYNPQHDWFTGKPLKEL